MAQLSPETDVLPYSDMMLMRRPPGWGGADAVSPGLSSKEEHPMDDVVNRFARELADAVAAAVAESAEVEECRERARAAGYEIRLSLEAVVEFASKTSVSTDDESDFLDIESSAPAFTTTGSSEMTDKDRRFLRSLRIAAGDAPEPPHE
jgi:hypothetical protein